MFWYVLIGLAVEGLAFVFVLGMCQAAQRGDAWMEAVRVDGPHAGYRARVGTLEVDE